MGDSTKFDTVRMYNGWPQNDLPTRKRRFGPPTKGNWGGGEPYNFVNTYPDARSVALLIACHGEDLVGLELGLYRCESFCMLLQVCQNIKTLYGIDSWAPYEDHINPNAAPKIMDHKSIDLARETALHFVHFSGESDRAVILEEDTLEAAPKFEDESLDFVFCDAHLNGEQLLAEMEAYYPKTKVGGLFMGHDWGTRPTRDAVREFRQAHGIDQPMFTYDETFVWKK